MPFGVMFLRIHFNMDSIRRLCGGNKLQINPDEYGFIAQLNEGHHVKKFPNEFQLQVVLQGFDPSKFNFTKVGRKETLHGFDNPNVCSINLIRNNDYDNTFSCSVWVFLLFIDALLMLFFSILQVNPIKQGHVVTVPRVLECFPQCIYHDSLSLPLLLVFEAGNPIFRLGYNSFGSFATINHLHFHLSTLFQLEHVTLYTLKLFWCNF